MRLKVYWFKIHQAKRKNKKNRDCQNIQDDMNISDDNHISSASQFDDEDYIRKYGLKSSWNPGVQLELRDFENDITRMITNVKQRKSSNQLQKNVHELRKKLSQSKEIIVESDKTGNHYKMAAKDYEKALKNEITKDYRKGDPTIIQKLNEESAKLAKSLDIDDRLHMMGREKGYINSGGNQPTCG